MPLGSLICIEDQNTLPGRAGVQNGGMGIFAKVRRVRGVWPTSPPPTVPVAGPPVFHCPGCRGPLAEDRTVCGACEARGWGKGTGGVG